MIINDASIKRWRYHPREKIIAEKHCVELHEPGFFEIDRIEKEFEIVTKMSNYKCVLCGNTWFGKRFCSNCKTHIYAI